MLFWAGGKGGYVGLAVDEEDAGEGCWCCATWVWIVL